MIDGLPKIEKKERSTYNHQEYTTTDKRAAQLNVEATFMLD